MAYVRPPRPVFERLMDKVEVQEDGCWLYMGARNSSGYGVIAAPGGRRYRKTLTTHRLMWETVHGAMLPSTTLVLHSCDVRHCVAPDHLRTGTHQDNSDDMIERRRHAMFRRTHCPQGHPLSGDNLKLARSRSGNRVRGCRECNLNYQTVSRTKRKQREKLLRVRFCCWCWAHIPATRHRRARFCGRKCSNAMYQSRKEVSV